jgi:hypothetical protein
MYGFPFYYMNCQPPRFNLNVGLDHLTLQDPHFSNGSYSMLPCIIVYVVHHASNAFEIFLN